MWLAIASAVALTGLERSRRGARLEMYGWTVITAGALAAGYSVTPGSNFPAYVPIMVMIVGALALGKMFLNKIPPT